MHADSHFRIPDRLQALAAMASLLERLDSRPRQASAEQYRGVVRQINDLLGDAEPDEALDALLAGAPGTAELYENAQYAYAGLCRSPLEAATSAEMAARVAIEAARRR